MKQHGILSLLLIVVLVGCGKPTPVVVLNGWWNVDYAKNGCESANKWHQENAALISQVGCDQVASCRELMPIVEACALGVVEDVRRFENDLTTEFAANAECRSVQFVYFSGPDNTNKMVSDAMKKQHYLLMLYYKPGARKQQWSMKRSDQSDLTQGEGNPEEIAKKVCSIAKEQGAKLAN
jgi:hypothetical protein